MIHCDLCGALNIHGDGICRCCGLRNDWRRTGPSAVCPTTKSYNDIHEDDLVRLELMADEAEALAEKIRTIADRYHVVL